MLKIKDQTLEDFLKSYIAKMAKEIKEQVDLLPENEVDRLTEDLSIEKVKEVLELKYNIKCAKSTIVRRLKEFNISKKEGF